MWKLQANLPGAQGGVCEVLSKQEEGRAGLECCVQGRPCKNRDDPVGWVRAGSGGVQARYRKAESTALCGSTAAFHAGAGRGVNTSQPPDAIC